MGPSQSMGDLGSALRRFPAARNTFGLTLYLTWWTEPSAIIMLKPEGWTLPKRNVSLLPFCAESGNRKGGRWSCAGRKYVTRPTSLLWPVNMFSLSPPSDRLLPPGKYLSGRKNFSPIMNVLLVPLTTSVMRVSLRRYITPLGP